MNGISDPTLVKTPFTTISNAIARDAGLDTKVKLFVSAALMRVGKDSHGKGYAPSGVNYDQWAAKLGDTCSNEGLNCWTALLFWAHTAGVIDQAWITQYSIALKAVAADMEAENKIMYSYLRANQVEKITSTSKPPIGRTIFFGDPKWTRPMNHVVVSVGDGYVVSQQSLVIGVKGSIAGQIADLNPGIDESKLFSDRLTHISKIELIAQCGEDSPSIKMTTKPFWELPRVPWI